MRSSCDNRQWLRPATARGRGAPRQVETVGPADWGDIRLVIRSAIRESRAWIHNLRGVLHQQHRIISIQNPENCRCSRGPRPVINHRTIVIGNRMDVAAEAEIPISATGQYIRRAPWLQGSEKR